MWLFSGGMAFLIAVFNLIQIVNKKYKYCSILVFASLSSALIAMLSQYSLINKWVQEEDMSALMDVVPTMNNVLFWVICVGIILNGIAVFMHYRRVRKNL